MVFMVVGCTDGDVVVLMVVVGFFCECVDGVCGGGWLCNDIWWLVFIVMWWLVALMVTMVDGCIDNVYGG